MIIRVFRAQIRPGKHAEFKKCIEILSLPNIQYRNGMVAFYPGQPSGLNADEFVLVTVWRDSAADRMQCESDWAKAVIPPEALPLLQNFDVQSYQSFGITDQPAKPLFNPRASMI
jgi:quinol monooxygenase YgiN